MGQLHSAKHTSSVYILNFSPESGCRHVIYFDCKRTSKGTESEGHRHRLHIHVIAPRSLHARASTENRKQTNAERLANETLTQRDERADSLPPSLLEFPLDSISIH